MRPLLLWQLQPVCCCYKSRVSLHMVNNTALLKLYYSVLLLHMHTRVCVHTQKVQEKPMCVKSVQASPHKSTPPTLPQNNEQEVGTKRKLMWKKDHLFLRSNSNWMIILKYLSKRGLTRGTLVGIWLHKQSVFLQSFSFPFHESMIQFKKVKVRFFFCTANTAPRVLCCVHLFYWWGEEGGGG